MTLYLVPPLDSADQELPALASKAGVTLLEIEFLHELWPHLSGGQIVIAALNANNLAILNRHMSTLLVELPVAVMAVPGASYRSDWNMIAHALPSEDWITLSNKMLKSGLLANDTVQGEKRSGAEPLSPNVYTDALSRLGIATAHAIPVEPEQPFDVDEVSA
uniref:Procapsid assembly protein n=1 Tax=Cystovirus phi6 TaxID=10879 RepID=J9SIQ4_9VIRU|nr:procapsid assembly protein [Pseudomonas phage phi6]